MDLPDRTKTFLGRGAFGTVYMYVHQSHTYALKVFHNTFAMICMSDPESLKNRDKKKMQTSFTNEIKVLKGVEHENIIRLFETYDFGGRFSILMEFAEGSLKDTLKESSGLTTEKIIFYTEQILKGLFYLHTRKPLIIHRDIRSANVLIMSDGVVKIADFGLCKHLEIDSHFSSVAGHPFWKSPELYNGDTGMKFRSKRGYCSYLLLLTRSQPMSIY